MERFVDQQAVYLMKHVPKLWHPEALCVAREAIHEEVERGTFDESRAERPSMATMEKARRWVAERVVEFRAAAAERRRRSAWLN